MTSKNINPAKTSALKISIIIPEYLNYLSVERGFAEQSIPKYRGCLHKFMQISGDRPVDSYTSDDIMNVKTQMKAWGLSPSWQNSVLFSFKSFLRYCNEQKGIDCLSPDAISPVKRIRRDVLYLSEAELQKFIASIQLQNLDGSPCLW